MGTRGRRTCGASGAMVTRHWGIVLALQGVERGLTVKQLIDRTGIPRSTLYRHLAFLEGVGVPLVVETVGGEARHRLMNNPELPKLGLTDLQVAALHLARTELEHLAGSRFVEEIDRLLAQLRPPERQASFSFAGTSAGRARILSVIDRALAGKRRLRLKYRSRAGGDKPEVVHVDPVLLRVADRTPYLHGHCIERGGARTYKLSRIESAEITAEPVNLQEPGLGKDPFARSRKAWTGEAERIRVRLTPKVAHLARDYPLAREQWLQKSPDGSLIVEATLAGHIEALPWILGWGAEAEVLEPAVLKTIVVRQLSDALARYGSPRATRAPAKKVGPPSRAVPRVVRLRRSRVGS